MLREDVPHNAPHRVSVFWLPVHMCTICVPDAHGSQNVASEPLELELQGVMNGHGHTGN